MFNSKRCYFLIYYGIKKTLRFKTTELEKLPLPEVTGGERGTLGVDKNTNKNNIDKYLGRRDSVYRDMRTLKDPGNYEAI